MKKIGVCGNFGNGKKLSNGQINKTRTIYDRLVDHFSLEKVIKVDSYDWKKNPVRLLLGCIRLNRRCEEILILPAQNGVKVFIPLFITLNKVFKRKLHYSVIGGWLPKLLETDEKLRKNISAIDYVYVETNIMKTKLEKNGLSNVIVMPNFKKIKSLSIDEIKDSYNTPLKVCTFSRVIKEKGIEDAILVIDQINAEHGKVIFELDIYGSVDKNYKSAFLMLLEQSSNAVNYKGHVECNNSVQVLKDYYALLFPTYYEGEGFPGTLIDAFNSGLPVIASDWKYNSEIIKDGECGLIYNFDKDNRSMQLKEKIMYSYYNKTEFTQMRAKCLKEATLYSSDKVMSLMLDRME